MTFMPDDFYQAVNRERTSYIVQYGRLKEFKASYQASGYHNKKRKRTVKPHLIATSLIQYRRRCVSYQFTPCKSGITIFSQTVGRNANYRIINALDG